MWSILSDCSSIPSIWPGLGWIWCDPTSVWLFLPVLDWFHLFMFYSASISRIWPVVVWCDLYSMIETVFLLLCDVICMNSILSLWPGYIRLQTEWCDLTCVWLILPVLDWFRWIMIYSTSISQIWPVAVWCDLYSMIAALFHLFGLDMVWPNLCLMVSTCIGLIPPVHDLFDQHIMHFTCCCVPYSLFSVGMYIGVYVGQWGPRGTSLLPESDRDFRPSQSYARYSYPENYLVSSLNDYCKRKKTPKIGYLDSSKPVLPYFRPGRRAGPTCFFNS